MKQYTDLSGLALLSIDSFPPLKKTSLKQKSKSPYGSPLKRQKPVISSLNTNIISIERISKGGEFLKELKEIYDYKSNKNYTINYDKNSLKLDMFILAARSDYFHGLFSSLMKENLNRILEVVLPDHIHPKIFKTFIKYLYYDKQALPKELNLEESIYLQE
mmetsp:Transcript_27053/g.23896  ORF Transcript_27053/g.23896 Transcript_27053/m.23896 type:complete len:161 (+) Transcript_27053:1650-2132(+)